MEGDIKHFQIYQEAEADKSDSDCSDHRGTDRRTPFKGEKAACKFQSAVVFTPKNSEITCFRNSTSRSLSEWKGVHFFSSAIFNVFSRVIRPQEVNLRTLNAGPFFDCECKKSLPILLTINLWFLRTPVSSRFCSHTACTFSDRPGNTPRNPFEDGSIL